MRTRTDVDAFFVSRPRAQRLYGAVERAVRRACAHAALGDLHVRVSKSQIAIACDASSRAFAWVWCPDRWLSPARSAPLVLSIALRRRDEHARWKEVTRIGRGRWMHHLELRRARDLDGDVIALLVEAAQANERTRARPRALGLSAATR